MAYLVLCAYDGSPAADRAFDFAASLAVRFRGGFHTLAAVHALGGTKEAAAEILFEAGLSQIAPKFDELRQRRIVGECGRSFELCVGLPPHQIVHRASELGIDHIVVGHQSRTAMQRWEPDSVAQRLVMHSSIPVTVVP